MNRACSIGIRDSAAAFISDQTSYIIAASYTDISQSNVTQRTARSQHTDKTNIVVARLVNSEVVQCMSAAIKFTCRKYRNVPTWNRI